MAAGGFWGLADVRRYGAAIQGRYLFSMEREQGEMIGGRSKFGRRLSRIMVVVFGAASGLLPGTASYGVEPRSLGLDVSAWQGDISQATWDAIHEVENRDFVFIRSSRGGTTGFYNQSNAGNNNPPGQNTLSQRYDDPYFVQNITRATQAGMFAGPYHFGRMDIIETTPYAGGIANTGADEADHFIQMAGPWMRPGYLVPVFDFEAGSGIRTPEQLAQFAISFSDRIYSVMGIRPAVYIGANYSAPMESIPSSSAVVAAYPTLWSARWPNQADPNSIPVQTADPGDYTPSVYGPWDNPPNSADPWAFWQYASTGRLQSYLNGTSNLDFDVANGGIEFLKDHLVPAVWVSNSSGDWNTLANWNSGQTPVAPVQGPGQVPRYGPMTLPNPRLPGADDAANNVVGANDTVVLDRPTANITVTLSTGEHFIRRLFVREKLDITGGSLAGSFAQVDAAHTLALSGGQIAFNTIALMPHNTTPGKLEVAANVDFSLLTDYPTIIQRGAGPGTKAGFVDLKGGTRTLNVPDGPADADLAINVPVINGGLTKTGDGTMALAGAKSVLGNTTVQTGTLRLRRRLIANTADVRLSNGATLDLTFTGTPDIVRALYINGVSQAAGTWGAVGSGAQFTSALITGSGMLKVDPSSPPDTNTGYVIDDFETDEDHFGWPYNFSPISQTFGLAASSTIDRVTTQHQGDGVASQLLNLAASGTNWQLRHNSGIGENMAAKPEGNLPLDAIGHVGFWLKTDDPNITVRLGIDDPVGGNTALERGVALDVVADNQWHLYQWDLEDELQWEAFAGGANGAIDAEMGTVTIDSIWFAGTGNAQIYLDTVLHNPEGPIEAILMPGDYNGDGLVNAADYTRWRATFGQSGPADGNGNGVIDAADYVLWRKLASMAGSGATAVPEPAALLLLLSGGLFLAGRRRRA
jgi:autotransporter-associated beta strand protein